MVLENLHKEKEDQKEWDTVDIWCHLGHAYITNVDEGEIYKKCVIFSAECTIAMVWGLTPPKHYGKNAVRQ